MSLPHAPTSPEGRPRRRRRIEAPASSSLNQSFSHMPATTPSSSTNANMGSASTHYSPLPDQNSGIAATDQPSNSTNVAPTQLTLQQQLLHARQLTIAFSDIMSDFQAPVVGSSPPPYYASDSDESDFDSDHEDVGLDRYLPRPMRNLSTRTAAYGPNRNRHPGVGTQTTPAIRAQPSMPHSAIPTSKRRGKPSLKPRAVPPPVLFLYEVQSNKTGLKQQNDSHASSTTTRYLPLIRAPRSQQGPDVDANPASTKYMIHPSIIKQHESSHNPTSSQWIPGVMPVELFEAITRNLSRDDIKNMRLVSREFEKGVSNSLFKTVVVPFNTELYDMIELGGSANRDVKGKGKAEDVESKLHWKNAKEDNEDKLYKGHGLRVFQGFGSHIRKFGMSFEVKEAALRNPPRKKGFDEMQSYFGAYDWPAAEYTRFEKLAGLERTADETCQMKTAFSHLKKVRELALCIDSGLGWVSGPEKSMRSQILQRDPPVFGESSYGIVDYDQQDRKRFWNILVSAYTSSAGRRQLEEGRLTRADLRSNTSPVPGLCTAIFRDTELWPSISTSVMESSVQDRSSVQDSDSGSDEQTQLPLTGVVYVIPNAIVTAEGPQPLLPRGWRRNITRPPTVHWGGLSEFEAAVSRVTGPDFQPAHLDTHQKEWLLEAEWAQKAFLSSYMLAIVDNTNNFSKITSLNLARISGQLVPLLNRHDFWDALPNLAEVSIGVIPDWRAVLRDSADMADTSKLRPSVAHCAAYSLLQDYIGVRPMVKNIRFGWAAGGEHAEGCISRNHHVLPAPVTVLQSTLSVSPDVSTMLRLPYVEHLTLSNCWVTPATLIRFVKKLELASLKKMTLDSVSLTAPPTHLIFQPPGNQLVANGIQHPPAPALPQPHQALHGQVFPGQVFQVLPLINAPMPLQQFGQNFVNGPPAGTPINQWAAMQIQDIQTVMMQQGITGNQLPQMWLTNLPGVTLAQITYLLGMVASGPIPWTVMNLNPGPVPGAPIWQPLQLVTAVFPPNLIGLAAATAAATSINQAWYLHHRVGSWVGVIDALSPGPTLEMYHPRGEFDPVPRPRQTPLIALKFISCGYVQLPGVSFDQNMLEDPLHRVEMGSAYHRRRRNALQGDMLQSSDRYLGRIVQYMSEREQDCLRFAWQMSMGWDDEQKAGEAVYDGFLPGGTGRFSGSVRKGNEANVAADDSG